MGEFSFETRRGAFDKSAGKPICTAKGCHKMARYRDVPSEKHNVYDAYMSIGKGPVTKYRKKNRIIRTPLVIVDASRWPVETDAQYSAILIQRNNYR